MGYLIDSCFVVEYFGLVGYFEFADCYFEVGGCLHTAGCFVAVDCFEVDVCLQIVDCFELVGYLG